MGKEESHKVCFPVQPLSTAQGLTCPAVQKNRRQVKAIDSLQMVEETNHEGGLEHSASVWT
jgi:hypothetical protein